MRNEKLIDYGISLTQSFYKFYYVFHLAVLLLVLVALSLIGGFVFQIVEAPPEARSIDTIIKNRQSTINQLRTKVNAKDSSKQEIKLFIQLYEGQYIAAIRNGTVIEDGVAEPLWTFEGSVYYCVTSFSLVGYGNLAPRTNLGRAIALIYCCFTVPISSMILSELGELLIMLFDYIWVNVIEPFRKSDEEEGENETDMDLFAYPEKEQAERKKIRKQKEKKLKKEEEERDLLKTEEESQEASNEMSNTAQQASNNNSNTAQQASNNNRNTFQKSSNRNSNTAQQSSNNNSNTVQKNRNNNSNTAQVTSAVARCSRGRAQSSVTGARPSRRSRSDSRTLGVLQASHKHLLINTQCSLQTARQSQDRAIGCIKQLWRPCSELATPLQHYLPIRLGAPIRDKITRKDQTTSCRTRAAGFVTYSEGNGFTTGSTPRHRSKLLHSDEMQLEINNDAFVHPVLDCYCRKHLHRSITEETFWRSADVPNDSYHNRDSHDKVDRGQTESTKVRVLASRHWVHPCDKFLPESFCPNAGYCKRSATRDHAARSSTSSFFSSVERVILMRARRPTSLFWLCSPFRYFLVGRLLQSAIRQSFSASGYTKSKPSLPEVVPRALDESHHQNYPQLDMNNNSNNDKDVEYNKLDEYDEDNENEHDDEFKKNKDPAPDAGSHELIIVDTEPVSLTIIVTVLYVVAGAILLTRFSVNMPYFDCYWFIFISILTIGYGDVVPTDQTLFVIILAYIFIGLCLMSNLVGETSTYFSVNVAKTKSIGNDAITILKTRKRLMELEEKAIKANYHWAILRRHVMRGTIPQSLIEESKFYKATLLMEEREFIRRAYKVYFKQEPEYIDVNTLEKLTPEQTTKLRLPEISDEETEEPSDVSPPPRESWWTRFKQAVADKFRRKKKPDLKDIA